MVTFKKFGRKYTVPVENAPTEPTRAQKKREANNTRYFKGARAQAESPPQLPPSPPNYEWALTGKGPAPLQRVVR